MKDMDKIEPRAGVVFFFFFLNNNNNSFSPASKANV